MAKSKFEIGDLVEILKSETDFRAHNYFMTGKLGLVLNNKKEDTIMDIWYVLIEDIVTPVMGKHLKKINDYEKK